MITFSEISDPSALSYFYAFDTPLFY